MAHAITTEQQRTIDSVVEQFRKSGNQDSALMILKTCRNMGLSPLAHARLLQTVLIDVRETIASERQGPDEKEKNA